ncbi:Uncharacterised protein [uncultured archaeon]|nr:Uncharacterised protein [uncultured archaeon]
MVAVLPGAMVIGSEVEVVKVPTLETTVLTVSGTFPRFLTTRLTVPVPLVLLLSAMGVIESIPSVALSEHTFSVIAKGIESFIMPALL